MPKIVFKLYWILLLVMPFTCIQAQVPGALDTTFNANDLGFGNGRGFSSTVRCIALQSDGKVLVGGDFSGGRLARLNANGAPDITFNIGTGAGSTVRAIVQQPDGKILVAGDFTTFNGSSVSRLVRLNADGSFDAAFNTGTGVGGSKVRALALQSDGKILVGGEFSSINGIGRYNLARLNADGSLDGTFTSGMNTGGYIYALAVQSNGKILIGGSFATYSGSSRNDIARLNADGSLDATFNPGTGVGGYVNDMALQADGKILIGGLLYDYNGTVRNGVARVNANGSLDATFNPGTGTASTVNAVGFLPDGRILISGNFTSFGGISLNRMVVLGINGSIDASSNNLGSSANAEITALKVTPSGNILIGGWFSAFNDKTRNRLAMLKSDGSLHPYFNALTGAQSTVNSIKIQPNGQILLGGSFTHYNDFKKGGVVRCDSNGSYDSGFNTTGTGASTGSSGGVSDLILLNDNKIIIGGSFSSYNGTSQYRMARILPDGLRESSAYGGAASSNVWALAYQTDGKVLVGGDFSGTNRNRIMRLNDNGALDGGWNSGSGFNSSVYAIALQADGKVVVGGNFTTYNGNGYNRIIRLNADGSVDTGFNPGTGANGAIRVIQIQPDGKILVGGNFTDFDGYSINRITRLNPDGSLDPGFVNTSGADAEVRALAIQTDGKILVGGAFTSFDGLSYNRLIRLNADGNVDPGFSTGSGANGTVLAITLQPDGNILIGGAFTAYNGIGRNYIARLFGSPPLGPLSVQTLSVDSITAASAQVQGEVLDSGSTGVWLRGVCYHTSPNPSLRSGQYEGYTTDYAGLGTFVDGIGPLSSGTLYYVRAFAMNATDTAYGQTLSFNTAFGPVDVDMYMPQFGFTNRLEVFGSIADDGGDSITVRGFVLNESGNPTYPASGVNSYYIGLGSDTGSFSGTFTGLSAGTTYFVRAYAVNSQGAFYSQEYVVSTLPSVQPPVNPCPSIPLVYDIDSNAYFTVEINNRCWLQTNLRSTRYRNGDSIQSVLPTSGIWGSVQNVMALAGDSSAHNYGHYYDWYAANDNRQLCPSGWHLPSKSEWDRLTQFAGGSSVAGNLLKAEAGWVDQNQGIDSLGFRGLPPGGKMSLGPHGYEGVGVLSAYWSSSEPSNTNNAFAFAIGNINAAGMNILPKLWGLSVRCTRDTATVASITTDSVSTIYAQSATVYGQVVHDGGTPVLSRGFCYNSTGNPTLADSTLQVGNGVGSYSATLFGLQPNTTYHVRAFATNAVGTAFGQELLFATTLSACSSHQLSSIAGAGGHYNQRFNWTAISGASEHRLQYRMAGSSSWSGVNELGTQRLIQNMAPGNYEARVYGVGLGDTSCVITFAVGCATNISYATNVFQAAYLNALPASSARVKIFNVSGGKGLYNFELENLDNGNVYRVDGRRNYTFSQLSGGNYTLRVYDAYNCQATFVSPVFIGALDTAYIPNLLGASNSSPNGFMPFWNRPRSNGQATVGILSYQLRVRNETDNQLVNLYTGISDTFFHVNNLTPGKLYRFNVRSRYTTNGGLTLNSAFSIRRDRTLGAGGNKEEGGGVEEPDAVRIYPNPTTDLVFVESPLGSHLKLLDLQGRVMQSLIAEGPITGLDLSPYAQGSYILEIEYLGQLSRQKVVKQ